MRNPWRKIDPEEEEDRARTLLTRRKFLFLGGAVAGAALLPPFDKLAMPQGWHSDLLKLDDVVATSSGVYYDREFIQKVKMSMRLMSIVQSPPVPLDKTKLVRFKELFPHHFDEEL